MATPRGGGAGGRGGGGGGDGSPVAASAGGSAAAAQAAHEEALAALAAMPPSPVKAAIERLRDNSAGDYLNLEGKLKGVSSQALQLLAHFLARNTSVTTLK